MTGFRKKLLAFTLMTMIAPLSACETVDSAVQGVKEQVAALDLTMPEITPTNKGIYGEEVKDNETAAQNLDIQARQPATRIEINDTLIDDAAQEATVQTQKSSSSFLNFNQECPQVTIVDELSSMHQFANPAKPIAEEEVTSVKITGVHSNCIYNDDNISVGLDLTFEGTTGPKARRFRTDIPSFAYPYFMAITSPNGNIIAKEIFVTTITYDNDRTSVVKHENIEQLIPRDSSYDKKHSIVIGFQLTEDELDYNRMLKGAMDFTPKSISPAPSAISKPEPSVKISTTETITPPQEIEIESEPPVIEKPAEELPIPQEIIQSITTFEDSNTDPAPIETTVDTTINTTTHAVESSTPEHSEAKQEIQEKAEEIIQKTTEDVIIDITAED